MNFWPAFLPPRDRIYPAQESLRGADQINLLFSGSPWKRNSLLSSIENYSITGEGFN